MTSNHKTRDIIRELAAISPYLSDDYTLTGVECDPGDSAVRVTKRNSDRTLYIIAYSEPDDTEIRLYDQDHNLAIQCSLYNGALADLTPEDIADSLRKIS